MTSKAIHPSCGSSPFHPPILTQPRPPHPVEAEIKQLVVDINRLSPGNDGGVPFGVLFDDDDVAQVRRFINNNKFD